MNFKENKDLNAARRVFVQALAEGFRVNTKDLNNIATYANESILTGVSKTLRPTTFRAALSFLMDAIDDYINDTVYEEMEEYGLGGLREEVYADLKKRLLKKFSIVKVRVDIAREERDIQVRTKRVLSVNVTDAVTGEVLLQKNSSLIEDDEE
jgi:hypothetical protein